jgi:hypothetical protein
MMTRPFVQFVVRGRAVACDWLLSVEGKVVNGKVDRTRIRKSLERKEST